MNTDVDKHLEKGFKHYLEACKKRGIEPKRKTIEEYQESLITLLKVVTSPK